MNSYCNNCGKNGHMFHQCKSPITSYGIIAFREHPESFAREYLMICRKDTLGFVDFMRGKYSIYNKEYISNMIKQMTNDEKMRLITDSFSKLWDDLWGTVASTSASSRCQYIFTGLSGGDFRTIPTAEQERCNIAVQDPRPDNVKFLQRNQSEFISEVDGVERLTGPIRVNTRTLPEGRCESVGVRILTAQEPQASEGVSSQVNTNTNANIEECTRFMCDILPSVRKYSGNMSDRDPYKAEEHTSKSKFESLKSGVYTKNDYYNLEELIRTTDCKWAEAEWGFPKGRRNYQEKDIDCAIREFCEETGYNMNKMIPLKNIQPFEEIFTGSNYKSYKHKYYVTYMKYEDTLSSRDLQVSEVSESKWMSFKECDAAIRDYNVEKKRLLAAVEKMLSDNCISMTFSV